MEEKVIMFDNKLQNTESCIQVIETTLNVVSGQRSESVLFSFYCNKASMTCNELYCLLMVPAQSEETNRLAEALYEFGEKEIDINIITKREIKIIPDYNNPMVSIYICGYSGAHWGSYQSGMPIFNIIVNYSKDQAYVMNNNVMISLSHKSEALSDISVLSERERADIEKIVQLQSTGSWLIKEGEKQDDSVDPSVLDEIRAVFDSLTQNEQNIVGMNELKIIKGTENSKDELDQMIGMDNIKKEIEVLEARLRYKRDMERLGFFSKDESSMHMCFLGAPGTGKTTVARIITGILSKYGYVKKNKCIEINARQFIGSYVGQTPFKTATIVKAAKGGVLFVDEAYTLAAGGSSDNYASEAIAQLLKQMEDDRGNLIVILAGYNNDMQSFLDINEGMRSRINKYINFENYTAKESLDILMLLLRKEAYYITDKALQKIYLLMKKCCMAPGFSNGRFVRNLYEKILEEHSYNVYRNGITGKDADVITDEDISEQLCSSIISAQR